MNINKAISGLMAAALVASFAGATAFAAAPLNTSASSVGIEAIDPATDVVNGDGVAYTNATFSQGKLVIDGVTPNSTLYIKLPAANQTIGSGTVVPGDLIDSKLFTFKAVKDTNSKLVSSMELYTNKDIGGSGRINWLKVVFNDNTMTSEMKYEGTVSFKAKKSTNDNADNNGFSADTNVLVGDTLKLEITAWVNNRGETNGGNPGAGDRIYFEPEANEQNTLIWGEDRAALEFDANDAGTKFYARLSTKAIAEIYTEYGDPINADLYFFDFVGNPTVPSTSRATLTLGMPWDTDSDYAPNPSDCYIYEKDADGTLTDVTKNFTYAEDTAEIEGWSTKTRTLGTYIISDMELDLESVASEAPTTEAKPVTEKPIPSTGSSDMVDVAVIAAIVSLAAAGALACKKISK